MYCKGFSVEVDGQNETRQGTMGLVFSCASRMHSSLIPLYQ